MSLKRSISILTLLVAIGSSSLYAQTRKASAEKSIEKIYGTWKIQKIVSGKTEVAKNPTSGHWIEFRPNGRYVNQTTSLDSGSFRLNENLSVLYLESQVNSDAAKNESKKIVEWTIGFENDMLTMKQNNKETKAHKDTMTYVYARIAEGSKVVNN